MGDVCEHGTAHHLRVWYVHWSWSCSQGKWIRPTSPLQCLRLKSAGHAPPWPTFWILVLTYTWRPRWNDIKHEDPGGSASWSNISRKVANKVLSKESNAANAPLSVKSRWSNPFYPTRITKLLPDFNFTFDQKWNLKWKLKNYALQIINTQE